MLLKTYVIFYKMERKKKTLNLGSSNYASVFFYVIDYFIYVRTRLAYYDFI